MKDPRRFAFAPDGTAIRRCVRCREPITAHAPECAGVFTPSQPPTIARAGDLARVRDRACEACGFVVCTPACEADTARALAEIEAVKAAQRAAAEADARRSPDGRSAHVREELRALDRVLARSPHYLTPPPFPDPADLVLTFVWGGVCAGAEVCLTERPRSIFKPRRLCVLRGDSCFRIVDVRVGMHSTLQAPVSAALYSIPMQRFGPTLDQQRPARLMEDVQIIARNIGTQAEDFEAILWGPSLVLPEAPPFPGEPDPERHAGRMAAAGCEHPAYVGCRFCAPE